MHHRVYFHEFNQRKRVLKTCNQINQIDRLQVAKSFLSLIGANYARLHPKYKTTVKIDYQTLLQHTAIYIDLIIIKKYIQLLQGENTGIVRSIKDVSGLKYHFSESYYYQNKKSKVPSKSKNYDILNGPFKQISDEKLYKIFLSYCYKNSYYPIKKSDDMSRYDLLKLLHYFCYDKPLKNLNDFVKRKKV